MSCHVMTCHVMSCHVLVMSCHVISCRGHVMHKYSYVTMRNVMSCKFLVYCGTWPIHICQQTQCHVMLCRGHVMPWHVVSWSYTYIPKLVYGPRQEVGSGIYVYTYTEYTSVSYLYMCMTYKCMSTEAMSCHVMSWSCNAMSWRVVVMSCAGTHTRVLTCAK